MKRRVCQKRRIVLLLIFALIFHCSPAKAGSNRIIQIAQAEIGKGETTSNNSGKDIQKYLLGKNNLSWCSAFVSWVLKQAEIDILDYSYSAKAIYNQAKEKNLIVEEPKAGDLIVFWRNKKNSWQGHVEIIEKVHLDELITIAGNVGSFPAKVKRVKYRNWQTEGIPKLLGFIRVKEK